MIFVIQDDDAKARQKAEQETRDSKAAFAEYGSVALMSTFWRFVCTLILRALSDRALNVALHGTDRDGRSRRYVPAILTSQEMESYGWCRYGTLDLPSIRIALLSAESDPFADEMPFFSPFVRPPPFFLIFR